MSDVAEIATLAHGYTMADLNRCAGVAVLKCHASRALDYDDARSTAWHGIVVELYTRRDPPQFWELLSAGMDAISTEATARQRHHGYRPDMPDGEPSPRFQAYWLPVMRQKHHSDDGFSDHLCEVMALRDALSVLTPEQYEAIATLAAYDNDIAAAAAALGMKYHGFYYRVLSGRNKIKAVWFGEETPVTSRPVGMTCRVGHSRDEHGFFREDTGTWVCRICLRAAARRRRARMGIAPYSQTARDIVA